MRARERMRGVGLRSGVAPVIAVLAGTVALVGSAPPAGAVTPCGEQVVADWLDNGRIDGVYELHCYEDGIDAIPSEIRDYTNAEDAIRQAYVSLGGSRPPTPPGDGSGGQDQPPLTTPLIDTSATTSVPLPVLMLGALALVLLGAGALGHVSRRRSGGDDGLPPA